MGVLSGKFGAVNGVSTVSNWTITDTMTLTEGTASNTLGGKARRKGIHDWSGSFSGMGGIPPVLPSNFFTFAGYTAPDNGVSGTGLVYTAPAIVESVTINWNWESGEIINWTVNMASDGPAVGAAGDITDLSVPDLPETCGTKIGYIDGDTGNGTGADTEWINLLSATLNISAANPTFVNSSTIFGGQCWTRRRAGVIDWNVSVTEQDNDRTKFDKGDDLFLRLYINATQYWNLAFAKLREFTGLTVDRQSGAILSQTLNFDMNSNRDTDGNTGFVVRPSGFTYWPIDQGFTTGP